jgi:hypothetical protein
MDCGYECEHVIAGRHSFVQEIRATLKRHGCFAGGASLSDVISEVSAALDKKQREIDTLKSRLTSGVADEPKCDSQRI